MLPSEPNTRESASGVRRRWRVSVVLRVSLAATFIGFGAAYAYTYVLGTVGTDGVVTGPLLRVTAPIDGMLTTSSLAIGGFVDKGDDLAVIRNPAADDRTPEMLRVDLASLIQELASVRRHLDLLDEVVHTMRTRVERHRTVNLERIRLVIEEADAAIAAAEARHQRVLADTERHGSLAKGIVAAAKIDLAIAERDVAAAEIRRSRARRARLEAELAGAEAGVFANDGYYGTPYAQQRLDDLLPRRLDLDARAFALEREVEEWRRRLDAETGRHHLLHEQILTSPANGVVWNVMAKAGSRVQEGQSIAEIAACTDLVVEVAVSESRIDRVRVGDPARVRLESSDRDMMGTVRSFRGAGAEPSSPFRAASIQEPASGMMTVIVTLPEASLAEVFARECHLGRTATVYLDDTRPVESARLAELFVAPARALMDSR